MNARGLLALISLKIGLQQGLITPALFAIPTTRAIVTTVVAAPLFEWVYRRFPDPARPPAPMLLGEPPLAAQAPRHSLANDILLCTDVHRDRRLSANGNPVRRGRRFCGAKTPATRLFATGAGVEEEG